MLGLKNELKLDWKSYYDAFARAHGWPVVFVEHGKKWLLFPDCWRYSLYSHSGPELPPPSDYVAFRELQATYWKLHAERLGKIVADSRRRLTELRSLSAAKSMPLICADGTTNVIEREQAILEAAEADFESANEMLQSL